MVSMRVMLRAGPVLTGAAMVDSVAGPRASDCFRVEVGGREGGVLAGCIEGEDEGWSCEREAWDGCGGDGIRSASGTSAPVEVGCCSCATTCFIGCPVPSSAAAKGTSLRSVAVADACGALLELDASLAASAVIEAIGRRPRGSNRRSFHPSTPTRFESGLLNRMDSKRAGRALPSTPAV